MANHDTFKELQDTLRMYKNEHNVDLLHNQGVTIHGKTYPGMHKIVSMFQGTGYDNQPLSYLNHTIDFHIPLENGHRIKVSNRYDDGKLQFFQEFPTKYMHGDGNFHHTFHRVQQGSHELLDATHDQMGHGVLADYNNDPEEFHNLLKRFAKAPSTGFRATTNSNPTSYKVQMYTEDLQAAHKSLAGKDEVSLFKQKLSPHIIGVFSGPKPGVREDYSRALYNINTEQLTKIDSED